MKRFSVVGNSGAGKTTLSARLAAALGVPHVELDAVFHQPGWTELPRHEFRRRVAEELDSHVGWVVDGNYGAVRDLVWAATDTVVWLDLPKATVMRRLIWRTVRRAVTREELWNGKPRAHRRHVPARSEGEHRPLVMDPPHRVLEPLPRCVP